MIPADAQFCMFCGIQYETEIIENENQDEEDKNIFLKHGAFFILAGALLAQYIEYYTGTLLSLCGGSLLVYGEFIRHFRTKERNDTKKDNGA